MTTGTCPHCARTKRLDRRGLVPTHYLTLIVNTRPLPFLAPGRVRRRCSGSGKPPRRRQP